MSKFESGDEVFFQCNSDLAASGRYVIDRLESDSDEEFELSGNGKVYVGEVYRLVGHDWLVPVTSLRAV